MPEIWRAPDSYPKIGPGRCFRAHLWNDHCIRTRFGEQRGEDNCGFFHCRDQPDNRHRIAGLLEICFGWRMAWEIARNTQPFAHQFCGLGGPARNRPEFVSEYYSQREGMK